MIDWNKCVEAFDDAAAQKLCKSRGYSKDVVAWLRELRLVGLHNGLIAFITQGGAHFKIKDGTWRFTEGAKASPLLLGPIYEGAHVHCFESQWDAIAFADVSGFRENIIATRGAGNAKLIVEAVGEHFSGTLYLWPQNDDPGRKWADDVRRLFPGQMKIANVPTKHKDLCKWIQSGAESSEVMFAMTVNAKDFPLDNLTAVPVLAEAPESTNKGNSPALGHPITASALGGLPATEKASDSRGGGQSISKKGGDASLTNAHATSGSDTPTAAPHLASNAAGTVQAPLAAGITSLAQALDAIVAFLKKYMRFESDWEADICALWIAHSWVFTAFSYTPYLHIMSPEKRCGKSRLLDLLELLVVSPWLCLRPSEAVMYRKIHKDKPTLLLDEVDTVFGDNDANEPIRAMLNGGYANGIKVPRCIGKTGDFEEFSVFCPKAIAGIGVLPDTVGDRCIHIPLARQPNEDRAERFRKLDAAVEVQAIRVFLALWAKESLTALSRARPKLPDLDGRHMDISEPLLAVAEAASEEWAEKGREAVITAFDQVEDLSANTVLLKIIKAYFDNHAGASVTTVQLLEWIVASGDADAPWISWWENQLKNGKVNGPSQKLARMLKDFKRIDGTRIKARTLNMEDDKTAKGFKREDFDLAFRRYLPTETRAVPLELGLVA